MSSYEDDLLDRLSGPDLGQIDRVMVEFERDTIDSTLAGVALWLNGQDPRGDETAADFRTRLIGEMRKFRQQVLMQHIARVATTRAPSHWSKR